MNLEHVNKTFYHPCRKMTGWVELSKNKRTHKRRGDSQFHELEGKTKKWGCVR